MNYNNIYNLDLRLDFMNDKLKSLFKGRFYSQIEERHNVHLGVGDRLILKRSIIKKDYPHWFYYFCDAEKCLQEIGYEIK